MFFFFLSHSLIEIDTLWLVCVLETSLIQQVLHVNVEMESNSCLVCCPLQEEYRCEGISWRNIDYIDNTGCINLISKKPTALFHLLDEECKWVWMKDWRPLNMQRVNVSKEPFYISHAEIWTWVGRDVLQCFVFDNGSPLILVNSWATKPLNWVLPYAVYQNVLYGGRRRKNNI